jgi:hypothetical protein
MTESHTSALVPEVGTLDPARLARLRRFGILLDSSIPIPGTGIRFGLENVIGLVPGIGDLIGGAMSLYILLEAHRMGAPGAVLARMGWNVAVDTLVGEVPILGDLFDVGFKANMRNLALLEGMVERPAETRRSSRRVLWLVILGLVLVTAGAIALGVLLIQFIASALQGGVFR